MPETCRCNRCGTLTRDYEIAINYPTCQACFDYSYYHCANCGEIGYQSDNYTNSDAQQICSGCWGRINKWSATTPNLTRNTLRKTGSFRCFGIELETTNCPKHALLKGKTCFGAKEDGSIAGMEFVSPILSGDKGLDEIRKFCRFAKQRGFTTEDDCGYHLHIDLRDTADDQRKKIAYAYCITFKLWSELVDPERLHNAFCYPPDYEPDDIRKHCTFDDFICRRNRYEFINLVAWYDHKTIEIRGYQGTLDATEICNWCCAHIRFVDAVKNMSYEEIKVAFGGRRALRNLRRIIGKRLAAYYREKWKNLQFA